MEPVSVTVSYVDLLERAANALGFDLPVYAAVQSPNFRGYVRVSSRTSQLSYVFDGDPLGTFIQSCEDAAKKALLFFVRNKIVCIHDVNFERVAMLRECRQLYYFKYVELDSIEMGVGTPPLGVQMSESSHSSCVGCVHLDYMRLLRKITVAAEVHVTPIECIAREDEGFQAWFTIENLGAAIGTQCVIGDRASSISDAKQVLAKKAISMVAAHCGVVVEDINFFLIPSEEGALKATREAYIARRDSVYGLQEQMSPTPNIIEQDHLTPCGKHFTVSTPDGPPPPPKKARPTAKTSVEATFPHSMVAPALDELAAGSHGLGLV